MVNVGDHINFLSQDQGGETRMDWATITNTEYEADGAVFALLASGEVITVLTDDILRVMQPS